MKKQVSIIWLIISAILVIFIVALLTYVYRQHSEIKNFKEQVYIEKEREKTGRGIHSHFPRIPTI